MIVRARSPSGRPSGLLVYTHARLSGAAVGARRARRRPERPARARRAAAEGDADRRRTRRGGRSSQAKVRRGWRLDYPRERLEVIVASDGSADRTAELARQARRRPRARAAARRARWRPSTRRSSGRRGEVLAFSDANTRLGARRPAPPGGRAGRPGVGYVCGQVRLDGTRAARTRRASTGATRWRCAALESRPRPG